MERIKGIIEAITKEIREQEFDKKDGSGKVKIYSAGIKLFPQKEWYNIREFDKKKVEEILKDAVISTKVELILDKDYGDKMKVVGIKKISDAKKIGKGWIVEGNEREKEIEEERIGPDNMQRMALLKATTMICDILQRTGDIKNEQQLKEKFEEWWNQLEQRI